MWEKRVWDWNFSWDEGWLFVFNSDGRFEVEPTENLLKLSTHYPPLKIPPFFCHTQNNYLGPLIFFLLKTATNTSFNNFSQKASSMTDKHFLLICLGAQGHINPTLHLAKNLLRMGANVTLLLTVYSARRIERETELGDRFTVATFSDGYDDGLKGDRVDNFLVEFRRRGREALYNLVVSRARDGRPFACIVHTLVLHWANEMARELHVPSALLWVQSAISFDIHYYFFNG